MALKPEVSIGVGLGTAALVYAIYTNATPNLADIRTAQPDDMDVEATRKVAAWSATAAVAAVSLIAKDPTVFILGGGMVVMLDWWHRHANAVDPESGKAAPMVGPDGQSAEMGDLDPQTYG